MNVIHDWQRGQIPFFYPPPRDDNEDKSALVLANDNKKHASGGTDTDKSIVDATDAKNTDEDNSILVDGTINVVPNLNELKATMNAAESEKSASKTKHQSETADAHDTNTNAIQDANEEDDDICWDDLDL